MSCAGETGRSGLSLMMMIARCSFATLLEAIGRPGWLLHAYVLMGNDSCEASPSPCA
jgi:hypothetical protein